MDDRIKKKSKIIQLYDNILEKQKKGITLSKIMKQSFLDLIQKIEFFSNIFTIYDFVKIIKFIDELRIKKYNKSDYIYHEGQQIPFIYILLNGNLEIEKQDGKINQEINEFGYVLNYNALNNRKNTEESVYVFNELYCIEIEYITFIEYNQGLKNIDISKNIICLSKFEFFTRMNLSIKEFRKIIHFFKPLIFNKGDIIYKENEIIDKNKTGIFFIVNGEFLISKIRECPESIETKIKKLDNQINKLKKEGQLLLEYSNCKKELKICHTSKNFFLTKEKNTKSNLLFLTKNNIFGEIEYINKLKYYPYTITCNENNSSVFYIPYNDLNIIENYKIEEILFKLSNEKSQLLRDKFYQNEFINKRKVLIKEYMPLNEIKSKSENKNINQNNIDINYINRNTIKLDKKVANNKFESYKKFNIPKKNSKFVKLFNIPKIHLFNKNNNSMNNSFNKRNYNDYSFFKTQNKRKNRILNTESKTNKESKRISLFNLINKTENSNHSDSNSNSIILNNTSLNNSNISKNHYYLNMKDKRVLNTKPKYLNFTSYLSKEKGTIKSFVLNKSPGYLNLFIKK